MVLTAGQGNVTEIRSSDPEIAEIAEIDRHRGNVLHVRASYRESVSYGQLVTTVS